MALLFSSVLYSKEDCSLEAIGLMEGRFGELTMVTPPVKWDSSDYYRRELGAPIFRRFVFFRELVPQDALAGIKLITNGIEQELSADGKRNVNLDPGYLTAAKVVLASTKDYSHRIYLRDDIFAEVTLMYIRGCFVPNLNTYRDYREDKCLKIFYTARTLLGLLRKLQ
jgi:hypothetical protein